jgi:hypothetical protein
MYGVHVCSDLRNRKTFVVYLTSYAPINLVGGLGVCDRHPLHPDGVFLERRFESGLKNSLEGRTGRVHRMERDDMQEEPIGGVVLECRRDNI